MYQKMKNVRFSAGFSENYPLFTLKKDAIKIFPEGINFPGNQPDTICEGQ